MSDDSSRLVDAIRVHGEVPRHVAIIMDGNGRWARQRHLPRPVGHREGMRAVRDTVEGAIEVGLDVLTLFAFSEENWSRPLDEIAALMNLLVEYVDREVDELRAQRVRAHVLGDLSRLSPPARAAVDRLVGQTAPGDRLRLNLCISYGSRAELTRAARQLADEVARGDIRPEEVDERAISDRLYTAGCPDPDLLIRTSGESRLSNFLLWQLAYTELHLTPVLWPVFRREHLFEAVLDYQNRDRRFGKVNA